MKFQKLTPINYINDLDAYDEALDFVFESNDLNLNIKRNLVKRNIKKEKLEVLE